MSNLVKKPYSREDRSLDKYLEEINHYNLLTADEEKELAREIRNGSEEALEKLVNANLRFVVSVAKNYQNQGMSLGDLMNEGNIGLIKAAKRFDETKGFKFISYAVWWIRQSILQALADQSRIVRLPLNRVGALHKIGKSARKLEQDFLRKPSASEIADDLEMKSADVSKTLKISSRHLSINSPFQEGDKNSLLDVLEDEKTPHTDEKIMDISLKKEVEKCLSTLKGKEAEVICLYFGINRERALTLEEIGARFSLTRERVRQIKETALKRLRHPKRARILKPYLEE